MTSFWLIQRGVIFFEEELTISYFRTNIHFTLKKNPMKFEDLKDFIQCYNPENRFERKDSWSVENTEGRAGIFQSTCLLSSKFLKFIGSKYSLINLNTCRQ